MKYPRAGAAQQRFILHDSGLGITGMFTRAPTSGYSDRMKKIETLRRIFPGPCGRGRSASCPRQKHEEGAGLSGSTWSRGPEDRASLVFLGSYGTGKRLAAGILIEAARMENVTSPRPLPENGFLQPDRRRFHGDEGQDLLVMDFSNGPRTG